MGLREYDIRVEKKMKEKRKQQLSLFLSQDYIDVKKDGRNIRNIKNPNKKLQKIAVQQTKYYMSKYHTCIIAFIENPDEEIQELSVRISGQTIAWINNPSFNIQRIAVNQDGCAISHIENPNDEIQKLAIKRYKKVVQYKMIKKLSKKVQEWFINQDPSNILKIPANQLNKKLFDKYRYLFSMQRAGILN